MVGIEQPGTVASARLFGPWAAMAVSFAVCAAAAGCVSAGLAPGPRIVYALAKDRLFPAPFARVHPRFKTPSFGIVIQAIWMSLLCLSGGYEALYTYATFFVILAYAATGIALFVLRRKRPGLPRPYRCWGYPVVPLLFVVTSLLIAGNTLIQQPSSPRRRSRGSGSSSSACPSTSRCAGEPASRLHEGGPRTRAPAGCAGGFGRTRRRPVAHRLHASPELSHSPPSARRSTAKSPARPTSPVRRATPA
jgi:hypothetical protein